MYIYLSVTCCRKAVLKATFHMFLPNEPTFSPTLLPLLLAPTHTVKIFLCSTDTEEGCSRPLREEEIHSCVNYMCTYTGT